MLRIRPTIVTRSTPPSGQCHYSIMSRAKQRAGLSTKGDRSSDPIASTGIPRNLIKPKANAQLPPSRRHVIHRETPFNESSSSSRGSTKEWATRGLAKKSALGEAMATASTKKSIPLGAPSLSKVTTATTTSRSSPFLVNPRQPAGTSYLVYPTRNMMLMMVS